MYYGDEEQIINNSLVLIVYKNEVCGSDDYYYEVMSIQECKYFPTNELTKILTVPEHYLQNLSIPPEKFVMIEFRMVDEDGTIKAESITDVTNSKDEFKSLH